MRDDELWEQERKLWLDGLAFYHQSVGPNIILMLPKTATILDRAVSVCGPCKPGPWLNLALSNQHLHRASRDVAILVYEAQADRGEKGTEYHAHCSSAYVWVGNRWMLIGHHRTRIAGRDDVLTAEGALGLFFETSASEPQVPSRSTRAS